MNGKLSPICPHRFSSGQVMMNCFCGMDDRAKALSLISSRDQCRRFKPSQISDTPQAEFNPSQNVNPIFVGEAEHK